MSITEPSFCIIIKQATLRFQKPTRDLSRPMKTVLQSQSIIKLQNMKALYFFSIGLNFKACI